MMTARFVALALILALTQAHSMVAPTMRLRGGGLEQTLAILKPDAVSKGKDGEMKKIIMEKGFEIVQEKRMKLSKDQAKQFYKEHDGKPFYQGLVDFMTSDEVVVMVLQKDDGIKGWRSLMGPTNSLKAKEEAKESLRARFGTDGGKNACHGSDSPASASREINFFFGYSLKNHLSSAFGGAVKILTSVF